MSQLTTTGRTILKSRVRRHPDLPQTAPGADVSALTVADLIQLAYRLGMSLPSVAGCAAYEDSKARGERPADRLRAADRAEGLFAGITSYDADDAAADQAAYDADADAADTDAEPATPAPAPVATPEADPIKTAADAAVADVLRPMGAGNMVGFQAALTALAVKAHTPPPVAAPVYHVDPSKIRGTVPQVVGKKTMGQAGIRALMTAREDATALDVYDAPDAPTTDDLYQFPDQWTAPALAALRRGRHVFLYGPAGTGKTSFAEQIAARYGRPFVRVSCDDQTEAATLTGMTVPDGAGGVKWQDGQLAAAIRRPGTVILIDEPSVARPGALMVMQALLDGGRALTVQESGERIPVAPGVIFIAADNTNGTGDETGAYAGTRQLNRAYLDRFCLTLRLDYMPTAQEAQIIAKRTGLAPKHALEIAKYGTLSRNGAQKGEVSHGLGIRRLLALAEQIADGVTPDLALQGTVIETAPFEDREPLRQLWTAHVTPGSFK